MTGVESIEKHVFQEASILVVCDDLEGCSYLEKAGFNVSIIQQPEDALALLDRNHCFDLLLLDLQDRSLRMLDILQHVSGNELDVAPIVLSDGTDFEQVSRAYQLGAFEYIPKPVEQDYLLSTLKKALEHRNRVLSVNRLRRQLERSEKLHRFMIDSSPDIIFIVDKAGDFRYVNDKAVELLGYRRNELLGQNYITVVDAMSIPKARHCFSEENDFANLREKGEIWLLAKQGPDPKERRRIAIELNTTGIYEGEQSLERSQKERGRFSGTYVVARDITDRLASERLIHYQAYHDLLTGLPNRMLFLDRLSTAIAQAKRDSNRLAVMFLDLDRFKMVNDSLGHAYGDQLLKALAERLKSCLRANDTLARLGGDEFIILLPNTNSMEAAGKVAEKILQAVRTPFQVGNHELYVTASIGMSLYPEDGTNADLAMYHSKGKGRDSFQIYSSALSEHQEWQMAMEGDIRKGMKAGEFVPYYQPQVMTDTGQIIGVEALMRWSHPTRGILTPIHFMAVSEESGLIVELGEKIFHKAIIDFKNWQLAGLHVEKLAVNFSFKQIEQPDFVASIVRALKGNDLEPYFLEIEITESTLMREAKSTIAKLRLLAETGVHIAIDDFGTGYSSLSLLQKLPIHTLKIDRSFIQDLQDDSERSIVEAIAYMARGLKLSMVAEGVELPYQLSYLQKLQCPVAQGHIFSEGLSRPMMQALLETQSPLKARTVA
jgi:diguanylate cyclase (GGDEF)-like protein/PAS domain S-box-containing protein